ncbi:MPP10 [Acanthosepion pharaonis]|uniref:U3 small nucleolar ribonucleoprotein protein MPP10 n=1 Tax=Acanthosepion pharaonis TaxID=158019 RepID=A0A812C1F5_ACAPH|nr:MPP10 [Sepia pharaonis]
MCLSNTLSVLSNLTRNLEQFLEVHEKNAESLKRATKDLYDFTYKKLPVKNSLSELVIDHFDNEQIWQELELYNTGVIGELIKDLSHLLARKEKISFKTTASVASSQKKNLEEDEGEEDERGKDEGEENEEESDEELKKIKSRLKMFDKIANRNNITSDLDSDFDADSDDLAKEFHEENDMLHGGETEEEEEDNELEEKVRSKDKKSAKKKASKPTIVDDKFFKLSEMDMFLKQQDALELKKSKHQAETDEEDEDIDMFEDMESDKEENVDKLKFDDFFRGPDDELPSKRVRFNDNIEKEEDNQSNSGDYVTLPVSKKKSKLFDNDSEEESDGEAISDIIEEPGDKSTFELRQERLQKKISQLEKANVADKSWQLSGEIGASARPENSLLEEHVQFDSTLKLAPEITEDTTKTLEDLIIQRIKDQAWDDVERKVKTADAAYEYKKPTMLDQEKSKLSLGEIYEKEYQKQEETQEDTQNKDNPEHEEIKKMMNSLFMKLDALSNFHFTPKISIPDVKIVANLPSITVEEVAPVGVSENQLAAPKELLEPLKNTLKGKTERNSVKTSKNKALRKLEKQSRSSKKVTVIKANVKKGKTSSADFFNQLQNEVTHEIKKKKQDKKKTNASGISSVQLKL